jgi:hypothetical protein
MSYIEGLSINITTHDVWLNFKSVAGKSVSLSVAALADRHTGGIIGNALREWASDRVGNYLATKLAEENAKQEHDDNGQFGAGS